MFAAFFNWLFRRAQPAPGSAPHSAPTVLNDPYCFEKLNQSAPLRSDTVLELTPEKLVTFLCREAVLGRNQRILGYHFMLQEGTRNRIRHSSRRVHHLYAEVLVRNLVRADIGRLLGHRLAFIDIPDSFLTHPCLAELPAQNVVLSPTLLNDEGAPPAAALREAVDALRAQGFRIAVPDPCVITELAPLLPVADIVMLRAPGLDARRGLQLSSLIVEAAPHAKLLVRDIPSLEDFRFCYKMGAALFQGPFITSRQDWSERELGPNTARIATLLGRLRADADTSELAGLLKQDAALSLRLLRYINSAANALPQRVSSIESALALLGRDRLYRWLVLLVCSAEGTHEGSSAALETALVRGRMMELMGASRPASERDALFLVGLLSLIDVIMQVPMEKALAPLALGADVDAALRRGEGPLEPMLRLAVACEQANGEAIDSAAQQCGISAEHASECHMQALSWAMQLDAD